MESETTADRYKRVSGIIEIAFLMQQIEAFESKWEGTFEEFSERCQAGTLGQDPYAYEVESDFWDWEKAETLLQHYGALQIRWM